MFKKLWKVVKQIVPVILSLIGKGDPPAPPGSGSGLGTRPGSPRTPVKR